MDSERGEEEAIETDSRPWAATAVKGDIRQSIAPFLPLYSPVYCRFGKKVQFCLPVKELLQPSTVVMVRVSEEDAVNPIHFVFDQRLSDVWGSIEQQLVAR